MCAVEGEVMPTTKKPKRPAPLTWREAGVELHPGEPEDADLAALQKKYGPPQPREPLPGQPALLPEGKGKP
jgi:hypothetical protein